MTDDDPPDLHDVEMPIKRQVSDCIDPETTPLELVSELDDTAMASRPDAESGHGSKYAIDAMVRLELGKRIIDTSDKALVNRLEQDDRLAAEFGFENAIPGKTVVSHWRNENYGEALDEWLDDVAVRITEAAIEVGNPIGLTALTPKDKQDASAPPESCHTKERRSEAAEEAIKMFATVYSYLRADNTTYPMETFLRVLAEMAAKSETARSVCRTDADALELVNLKPIGDTFRHHPNELDPAKLVRMHDRAVEILVKQIKQYIEFERLVEVGTDWTTVELPGDPEKTDQVVENIGEMFEELDEEATGQFVQGYQQPDSGAKVYKFMSLNIVDQHFRIPLVVRPMPKGVPYRLMSGSCSGVLESWWPSRRCTSTARSTGRESSGHSRRPVRST